MKSLSYSEIISQVARRLGYEGMERSLRSDFRFAISFAESQLMDKTEPTQSSIVLDIVDSESEYGLRNDFGILNFNSPYGILMYSSNGELLSHEEVDYSIWMRWNPAHTSSSSQNDVLPSDRDSANPSALVDFTKYHNRVLVSIHYSKNDSDEDGDYVLSVKPAITGKVILNYSIVPNEDIFENLDKSPSIPPKFHNYIIAGAVWRLSQIEAGKNKNDLNQAQFWQNVEARAYAEFQKGLSEINEGKGTRKDVAVARGFLWFEKPSIRNRRH